MLYGFLKTISVQQSNTVDLFVF